MSACIQWSFAGAAICYTAAFALLWSPFQRLAGAVFLGGILANGVSVVFRYSSAWPMMPLFQAPAFLSLAIGVLCLNPMLRRKPGNALRLSPMLLTAYLALLFPKDYYLPFIHSATFFAHLFFLFGIVGKACLFLASVEALQLLWLDSRPAASATDDPGGARGVVHWIAWGFGFLSLSMFSGEMWSYLGWGSPIVWDDPTVMSTMSVWCLYACFLHLHLSRSWDLPRRLTAAVAGAVVLFVFTAAAEMGVFQWPNWH